MIWRLHREVERRGRLVEQDEFGLQRDGAGDGDALALAAGEFVREARTGCCRVEAGVDAAPSRTRSQRASPVAADAVDDQPFLDDLPDRHARVERGERVLEDDLHARAEAAASRPSTWSSSRLPVEVDLAAVRVRCSRRSAWPKVVLPEPDSPTMPSVSCALQRRGRRCRRRPARAVRREEAACLSVKVLDAQPCGPRARSSRSAGSGFGRPAARRRAAAACRRAAGWRTAAAVALCSTTSPCCMT